MRSKRRRQLFSTDGRQRTDGRAGKGEKGRFENLTVGICGDLKYGRTVHSLITALKRYAGVRFVLISPDELQLPEYIN